MGDEIMGAVRGILAKYPPVGERTPGQERACAEELADFAESIPGVPRPPGPCKLCGTMVEASSWGDSCAFVGGREVDLNPLCGGCHRLRAVEPKAFWARVGEKFPAGGVA